MAEHRETERRLAEGSGGLPTPPAYVADLAGSLQKARLRAFLDPGHATGEAPDVSELDLLVARAASVYASAITEQTRATYVRRWGHFVEWCELRELQALPASSETVMLFLADAVASRAVSLSTMRGWAAAVARVHLEAGYVSPTEDPSMTLFLRGLSRMAPARERQEPIAALRIAALRAVCRTLDHNAVDAREVRDRAMIALLAAGAHEASVARLKWIDVTIRPRSAVVTLHPVQRSTTSRTAVVLRLREQPDRALCPVHALRAWKERSLDVAPTAAVFPATGPSQVAGRAMRTRVVSQVWAERLTALSPAGSPITPEAALRLLGNHRSLDLRDKAILLVGFAGAFRRGEVTNLRWSDIRNRAGSGIVIQLRRSKTDQAGRGKDVGIPLGRSPLTCPVRALDEWRERVELQNGPTDPEAPVFVHVGRSGRITQQPLTPEGLTMMVRRRAEDAGLEGRWGGRSLRAGFISTAADLEIPLERVAAQSRHMTLDSLARYIRRLDPFTGSAAGKVGL